tara:strand:- start:100 stop:333 length:234 start_codon:yes stop_codon:yes gene_type:complete
MSGSKRVSMGEIQKAVAKECLIYNDTSKKRITEMTRAYIRELKKEGFYIVHSRTQKSNAVRVNYFIENGTLNNTNGR